MPASRRRQKGRVGGPTFVEDLSKTTTCRHHWSEWWPAHGSDLTERRSCTACGTVESRELEMPLADWEAGMPCEADGISFCARCKPKPFPVNVVITGGGQSFHLSADCRGLREGQGHVERRGGTTAAVKTVHREVAISGGYLPCLLCFPEAKGRV